MTQAQFLLFLISVIPITNYVVLSLCKDSYKLVNIVSKFLPILFFLHLVGLANNLDRGEVYIQFIETVRGIFLSFMVNQVTLKFLFLLNFIWIVFVFYSHRFLRLTEDKLISQFKVFFAIAVALVNLILIAQNLLSTLFFYNCLVLLCHFFAIKFLHKKETKFSYIFTFLRYLESLLFFLAIVATYKFGGRIDFIDSGVFSDRLNHSKLFILLALYLGGLFLSMSVPSYLLYRNSNINPLIIYALFFVSYAFSSFYIFIKIVIFIFGLDYFSQSVLSIGFRYFELVFLSNLLISGVLLLISKNLKSSFFYLFFNQFIFALFAIFCFAIFDESKIYLSLFSFLLSITLVFLCLSNMILYVEKAEDKSIKGLFYKLKITSILLIFSLANLIGVVPGIGILEKFFLLKILLKKKLILGGLIFLTNSTILILFACRLVFLLLYKQESQQSESDFTLAKVIDFDSSLILTALITAIIIFLAIIFYPLLTNFFSV